MNPNYVHKAMYEGMKERADKAVKLLRRAVEHVAGCCNCIEQGDKPLAVEIDEFLAACNKAPAQESGETATRKAKQENDKRFQIERDEARAELQRVRKDIEGKDAALMRASVYGRDKDHRELAAERDQLRAEVERLKSYAEAADKALELACQTRNAAVDATQIVCKERDLLLEKVKESEGRAISERCRADKAERERDASYKSHSDDSSQFNGVVEWYKSERDAAIARAEKAEAELAATRKAKQENDKRFMVERDEARAPVRVKLPPRYSVTDDNGDQFQFSHDQGEHMNAELVIAAIKAQGVEVIE